MAERRLLCFVPERAEMPDLQLEASWTVHTARDVESAQRLLQAHRFLVGLLVLPSVSDRCCTTMDRFLRTRHDMEWVGVFDAASIALPECRDLVLEHLFDHHTLPVDPKHLAFTLGHAHGHAALRERPEGSDDGDGERDIVGRSDAVRQMRELIRRVAKVDAPVLVTGESGSGKELAAHAIHAASARAGGPFVPVNCGAIPASLIQSELFGHARGAFTGAARDKRGLIEAASGGTVFLDEIGDLPLDLQANLLRFLQESTITRVGSTQSLRVDARVIAATNVALETAVARGTFREDLYYRLNVLPLRVPALRERRADIEPLARHVFARYAQERNPRLRGFGRRAICAMEAYSWPGNVRELINRVRRAMALAEGRLIAPADLGLDEPAGAPAAEALDRARVSAERHAIHASLLQAGRNISQAARHLGVSRMTLYRLMAKHGIEP